MQPHSAVCIVVIKDAQVGVERHARRSGRGVRQVAQIVGQRRRRQAVEIGSRLLIPVGLPVPVAAQAQHADAHPAAAADDGHVGGDGAVDERAALLDDRALRVDGQVMVEVNGARGDFHTSYATIGARVNAELAE